MNMEILLRNVCLSLLKTTTTKQYRICIAFVREKNTRAAVRAEFSSVIVFTSCVTFDMPLKLFEPPYL